MHRWIPFALALVFFVIVLTPCGRAQSTPDVSLTVTVTDDRSQLPVPLAKVLLIGPTSLVGLTGKDGTVSFDGLRSGTYSGYVFKDGYQTTPIRRIRIDAMVAVKLSAHLGHQNATIGSVVAKAQSHFAPNHRTEDAAEAIAGGTLSPSLETHPDVLADGDAATTSEVQIDGRATSQTGITTEGAPLVPPGAAGNLRTLPLGLFDAADIGPSAGAFGNGGSIDFHIPDPTLAFSSSERVSSSGVQQYRESAFARGTIGYVGFSVGHALQGDAASIDGERYTDITGLAYQHEAATRTAGDVVKVRAPLSATNVLSGFALGSAFHADQYCLFFVGATPCGNGPGSGVQQALSSYQLKDSMLIGNTSLSVTAFGNVVSGSNSQPDRPFLGFPLALASRYSSNVAGLMFNAKLTTDSRSTFSIDGSEYGNRSTGSADLNQIFGGSPSTTSRYGTVGATYGVPLSDHLTASLRAGINGATTTRSTPFGGLDSTLLVGRRDHLDADLSSGLIGPTTNAVQGLSNVQDLNFDCHNGTALGSAPSSVTEAPESTTARATYTHRSSRFEFVATAYQQRVHGALVSGWISGSALSPSLFPAGYAQAASAYYNMPGICAAAGVPFSNFALMAQDAMTADFRGVNLTAEIGFGAFVVEPFYAVTIATPDSSLAGSTIQAGTQMWSVPPHRFGTVMDWKSPSGHVEAALTWRHVSTNNPQGLPSYDLLDVGTRISGRGDVTLSVRNFLNTQSAALTTTSQGSPFIVPGIGIVGAAPTPLQPRSIAIGYRFHIGSPERPTNETEPDSLLPTSTTFVAPNPPDSPPAKPFEIDRNNSNCGPEQAALAENVLAALKIDVAGVHIGETVALPEGESAYVRRDPAGALALLIVASRAGAAIALYSCATVYALTSSDVEARSGYLPKPNDPRFQLIYSPTIGLYIVLDGRALTKRTLDVRQYSGKGPAEAFAIRSRPACTADVQSAAVYVLDQLRSYFVDGLSKAMDGVSARVHDDPNRWFTLTFEDPSIRDAVMACADISMVSASQAKAAGIGTDPYPAIDYATPVGLYFGKP